MRPPSTILVVLCAAGALCMFPPPMPGPAPPAPPAGEPPLDVSCPCGYALHKARSNYSSATYDRQWDWNCIQISEGVVREKCEWYTANELQKTMIFRCPKREYMAGIRSVFSTNENDRAWEVRCCETAGLICPTECFLSCDINTLTEDIDYCASDGNIFVGLVSKYFVGDRLWRIEECEASKCQLFPGIEREKRSEGEVPVVEKHNEEEAGDGM